MWTAEARAKASMMAHQPRVVPCGRCGALVTTKKHGGYTYCPACRIQAQRDHSREVSDRKREERVSQEKDDKADNYIVLFDPDQDLTGTRFDKLNIDMMLMHKSLSFGAAIQDPDGRVFVVGLE
jgi:uncharacterized Zn finger protein (UPF0148 family)